MIAFEIAKQELKRPEVKEALAYSLAFGAVSSVFSALALKHIEPDRDLKYEIFESVGVGLVTGTLGLAWMLYQHDRRLRKA